MTDIQLRHGDVSDQIKKMESALQALNLPTFHAGDFGRNQTGFSAAFTAGEAMLEQIVSEYVQIVQKNLADTQANVDYMKSQDEAIKRITTGNLPT